MTFTTKKIFIIIVLILVLSVSCSSEKVKDLSDLNGKMIGILQNNKADLLDIEAIYKDFDNLNEAVEALKTRQIDALLHEQTTLNKINRENKKLRMLESVDILSNYAFAVRLDNILLKNVIDKTFELLASSGIMDDIEKRWLSFEPQTQIMPEFDLNSGNRVLRFGTSANNEPFSFIDKDGNIVGIDIELAHHIAQALDMNLEIINMRYAALVPAIQGIRVDIIGAGIVISEELEKRVIFSKPYFEGQVGVLVRK